MKYRENLYELKEKSQLQSEKGLGVQEKAAGLLEKLEKHP